MARQYVGAEYSALLRIYAGRGQNLFLWGHNAANNMQADKDHTIM